MSMYFDLTGLSVRWFNFVHREIKFTSFWKSRKSECEETGLYIKMSSAKVSKLVPFNRWRDSRSFMYTINNKGLSYGRLCVPRYGQATLDRKRNDLK